MTSLSPAPAPVETADPLRIWFRFIRLNRRATNAVASELKELGLSIPQFDLLSTPLTAACLVGAIAEALVGPLSPPARAAREPGQSQADLDLVSRNLVFFCLRAVGAATPA